MRRTTAARLLPRRRLPLSLERCLSSDSPATAINAGGDVTIYGGISGSQHAASELSKLDITVRDARIPDFDEHMRMKHELPDGMVMSDLPYTVEITLESTSTIQIGRVELHFHGKKMRSANAPISMLNGIATYDFYFVVPSEIQDTGQARIWILAGGKEWPSPEFEMRFKQ